MQIELRFRIPSESLSTLRRYPPLRQVASSIPHVEKRSCSYFDTPDLLLRNQGLALHIVRVGRKYKQVLDALSDNPRTAFLHERELEIPNAKLDLQVLAEWLSHEARFHRRRIKESHLSAITPIFVTDISRTDWQLALDGECSAVMRLEHGDVKCGLAQHPISELTLTLRSGGNRVFYDFALALQQDMQLHPLCRDSVQSAFALRDLSAPPVVTAKPLMLHDDDDVVRGMQTIIANCFEHIHRNATGVVHSGDIESVHQMRVGLRRLRSVLDIFESVIPCPVDIRNELAWLSTELGNARDWEVLDSSTLPALAACWPSAAGLIALQSYVHQEAIRKHLDAALAVDSVRSARLWLLLHRWLLGLRGASDEQSEGAITAPTSLRQFAAAHIRRIHKKAQKRCEAVQITQPESCHRVRIASKKLRYATEFFASYYRDKSVTRFIGKLSKLQDVLGASNDMAVAGRLFSAAASTHPELVEICAFFRGYQAALDDSCRMELGKRIRRFNAMKKLRLRKLH
jgi:triphosphatase